MKTLAFFNDVARMDEQNALLVFELSWMLCDLGYRVLTVDLDPASHLTSLFLDDDEIDKIWVPSRTPRSVLDDMMPLMDGRGVDLLPSIYRLPAGPAFLASDPALANIEGRLAQAWENCLSGDAETASTGFRITTALQRVMASAGSSCASDLILVNVGANLGAINRAALIASDFVVVPISHDPLSLRALRNLGGKLRDWRSGWQERKKVAMPAGLSLFSGGMKALGYIRLDATTRGNRLATPSLRHAERIPTEYANAVLEQACAAVPTEHDPNQLAKLTQFKSLMPMAQDARKPMFHLTAADGAIGGHAGAVQDCKEQFKVLAERILERADIQ